VALLLLPAALFASTGPKTAPSQEVIDGTVSLVQRALKSGDIDEVKHACKRALVLRPDCDAEQFEPVARAVSRGLRHKDARIALTCVRTLGKFNCPQTPRCIAPLLSPPRKVKDQWLPVHLAAIEIAGQMHQPRSVPPLEKLIHHESQILARAACDAFAGYKVAPAEEKQDVVRRLATQFGRLERKKAKGAQAATELRRLREALRDSLRVLTGVKDLETSTEAREWLHRQPEPVKPARS
jgi:uncharacterized protein with von Willebrand factor type A (vWA) domain